MMNEELKRLRKEANLTQTELAEKLNLSQSTIASWESGKRRPDLDLIPSIAQLFGVSVNDIYGLDDQEEEKEPAQSWHNKELFERYLKLTPENRIRIDAYLEGLLASQSSTAI